MAVDLSYPSEVLSLVERTREFVRGRVLLCEARTVVTSRGRRRHDRVEMQAEAKGGVCWRRIAPVEFGGLV